MAAKRRVLSHPYRGTVRAEGENERKAVAGTATRQEAALKTKQEPKTQPEH